VTARPREVGRIDEADVPVARSFQNLELVAQSQDLQLQSSPIAERRSQGE
jgi:hypothetical protein